VAVFAAGIRANQQAGVMEPPRPARSTKIGSRNK